MRAVIWFSGIGGLTLACQRAGIDVVGCCELDPRKRAVHSAHFADPEWFPEDFATAPTPPPADLWIASQAPKPMQALLDRWGDYAPPRLWLQTIPQQFVEQVKGQRFVRGGRLHVVTGCTLPDLSDAEPIHRPDAQLKYGRLVNGAWKKAHEYLYSIEEAEEAQGFARGYTAVLGDALDAERLAWLRATVNVDSATVVAKAIAAAG